MTDSPRVDPDITPETPTENISDTTQQEAPDRDVTNPDEVDPEDGTDTDDEPVDNPAG